MQVVGPTLVVAATGLSPPIRQAEPERVPPYDDEVLVTYTLGNDLYRPNTFEVDLGAIVHNIRQLRETVGPGIRVYAAVKANAYGYGLTEVASAAVKAGVSGLALADLREGVRLRRSGVELPILLYAGVLFTRATVAAIEEFELTPTVVDWESARRLGDLVSGRRGIFVKVDVGLERVGVHADDAVDLLKRIVEDEQGRLVVEGLYTHMHVAEAEGRRMEYLRWQYERLVKVVTTLKSLGMEIPTLMAASTGVLNSTGEMVLNAVDPGHLIYGLTPAGSPTGAMSLRPAFRRLASTLIQVKAFRRSDFIRETPFPATGVSRVGIIPFGRADGMHALTTGFVLVRGMRARILGDPSLEHTRVDLSQIPQARVGDEAVIIGEQDGSVISVNDVLSHQQHGREAAVALEVREPVCRLFIEED
ncbi:MAG: alanine racemase [Actinomycetota bacterium]